MSQKIIKAAEAVLRNFKGLSAGSSSLAKRQRQRENLDLGTSKDLDNFIIEKTFNIGVVYKIYKAPYDLKIYTIRDSSQKGNPWNFQFFIGYLWEEETAFPAYSYNQRRKCFSDQTRYRWNFIIADWRPKGFLIPKGSYISVQNNSAVNYNAIFSFHMSKV